MKKPFIIILYCIGIVFAIVWFVVLPYASAKSYIIEKLNRHELPSQSLAMAMTRYYFFARIAQDIVPFIIGMIVPSRKILSSEYGYVQTFMQELQYKRHAVALTILMTTIVMQINYLHVPLIVNLMINSIEILVHVALGSLLRTLYIMMAKRFKVSLFE